MQVAHLDLELFTEAEEVGDTIETYTVQDFKGCASQGNLTTDL